MPYVEGSHTCYLHAVGALQPDVLLAVRDITRVVTALTPNPYNLLKAALIARYSQSPLQKCYELDRPPPLVPLLLPATAAHNSLRKNIVFDMF